MANLAALRAAVFSLSAKNLRAPPAVRGLVIGEKHRRAVCSAVSGYFAVGIPFFFTQFYPFSEPEPEVFDGFGSGSGYEHTVSTTPDPTPTPTKMCRLRRLRLRLPPYPCIEHLLLGTAHEFRYSAAQSA